MTEELKQEEDIIEITSHRFSIDWTYDEKHKINLKDIWGVELHWRGDSWHVVVVTRERLRDDSGYSTYELSHWVNNLEIKKILNNPLIMVKKIVNYHSSKNFIQEIQKVLPQSK